MPRIQKHLEQLLRLDPEHLYSCGLLLLWSGLPHSPSNLFGVQSIEVVLPKYP